MIDQKQESWWFYELFKFYDVENIIRIGSCGSNAKDIKLLDEKHREKMNNKSSNKGSNNTAPQVKTRYHNINQTFKNYSDDELEKLLQESQKGKFK